MNYGILDEAGDTGRKAKSSKHILVAIILVHRKRQLQQAVSRTRKRLGKKKKNLPEFKASHCEIVAVVVNKQHYPPADGSEQLYRNLCAYAVKQCLVRHNRLSFVLDKRYTNPRLRARQNESILATAETLPQAFLSLEHLDSQQEPALQAADAVAWAFFQKYEHENEEFYNIIKNKIVNEEILP